MHQCQRILCRNCLNNLFSVSYTDSCEGCSAEGAWDGRKKCLTFDDTKITRSKLTRCSVGEDALCFYGAAYGNGCYLYTCSKCGGKQHIPNGDFIYKQGGAQ
jgi:hypothetical protein